MGPTRLGKQTFAIWYCLLLPFLPSPTLQQLKPIDDSDCYQEPFEELLTNEPFPVSTLSDPKLNDGTEIVRETPLE
jgi:hypothetical protein